MSPYSYAYVIIITIVINIVITHHQNVYKLFEEEVVIEVRECVKQRDLFYKMQRNVYGLIRGTITIKVVTQNWTQIRIKEQ